MTTKIQVFKNKDPIKLAEDINNFNETNQGFSTQVFPSSPWSEYWVAYAYYSESNNLVVHSPHEAKVQGSNPSSESKSKPSEKKEEFPELATQKQIDYLYGLGVSNFNPKTLTRKGAKWLIEETLEEQRKADTPLVKRGSDVCPKASK